MYNRQRDIPFTAALGHLPHAKIKVLIVLLLASITACTTHQAMTLRVDPQHDQGAVYPPEEVSRMMADLGYQRLRVTDPVTEQSVAVAEKQGEYRLLFQSSKNDDIRVDVHIVMEDGRFAMYFYNINDIPPDDSALQLYEQLRKRVTLEYGAGNVSSSYP